MYVFLRQALVTTLFLLAVPRPAVGDEVQTPAPNPQLAAADVLWRSGKFADAEERYRAILQSDPKLVPAQVGLVRALLRQQKVEVALDSVNAALVAQPNSAALLAARGEVQFRLGKIEDAETSYLSAKNLDENEILAYLGLTRVYRCESLYFQAQQELRRAHQLAPDDPEVQRAWLVTLPPRERLAALQAYLAGPHPEDEEETRWMLDALAFLKETVGQPTHACKLVSKVEKTEARLDTMRDATGGPSGVSLSTKLNDRTLDLQLDTGASGILVGRKLAEKAGLIRIADAHFGGIGDKGIQSGYTAVAAHIQIGELVFQDCAVMVTDKSSGIEKDGLIGADMFAHYLVDIDLAGMRLILSPLPRHPEEPVAPAALGNDETGLAIPEKTADDPSSTVARSSHQPHDRYIAPGMAKWTKVYRFGHTLLVPTVVNESDSLLFGIDTGAFDNILSERTGRQVGKLKSRHGFRVRGIDGDVKKVYSSKVTLRFGHLQQSDIDTITVDLSKISRQTGTEISGFLGFALLQMLDVKLDYRDGLVNLEFDPKRVQHLLKK